MVGDISTEMLAHFRRASEEQQRETVMLAGNARYVLRMTEHIEGDDVLRILRSALVRGIPSLGGEPL